MAKTALTLLQDQIEAIRHEAYNAGYAAAMRAVRDFAARPATTAASPARQPRRTKAVGPAVKRRGRPPAAAAVAPRSIGRRPRRGTNAPLIAEVLKAMPSRSGRPADIRKALQSDKGVSIAYTSIRHGLNQLAIRKEVEASADGRTWRYVGTPS
jgi:hypothetical protein